MYCTVDKKLWKYLFLGLHILVLPTLCFKIKDLETRTVQLFLRNNGELEDTSQIPNCGSANKIVLNSFAYDHQQCSRIACSSVYKEALSKATAFQLYQNCSFRQKCQNLHFPVRNVTSGLYAVTIQYQCIDEGSLIVNMCEQHELNFNGTLHLLFKNYSQNFKNCECWVNKGPFSPLIMDVRLNTRHEDKCSTSKLMINNKYHYQCDARSDSYGAIFGEALQDDLLLEAFISLVHNSDIIPPEMVWIALIPEGESRLVCYGDRITSQGSSNMATTPTPCMPREDNDTHTAHNVAIGVLATVVGAFIAWRLWRKYKHSNRRKNTKSKTDAAKSTNGNKDAECEPLNSLNQPGSSEHLENQPGGRQPYRIATPDSETMADTETTPDTETSLLHEENLPGYPDIRKLNKNYTVQSNIDMESQGYESTSKKIPCVFQTSDEGNPVTAINTPSTSRIDLAHSSSLADIALDDELNDFT